MILTSAISADQTWLHVDRIDESVEPGDLLRLTSLNQASELVEVAELRLGEETVVVERLAAEPEDWSVGAEVHEIAVRVVH